MTKYGSMATITESAWNPQNRSRAEEMIEYQLRRQGVTDIHFEEPEYNEVLLDEDYNVIYDKPTYTLLGTGESIP